jgi:hypothetical protein
MNVLIERFDIGKWVVQENKNPPRKRGLIIFLNEEEESDQALSTLPDLRQLVHTYARLAAPFSMILTLLILDFHIWLDLL